MTLNVCLRSVKVKNRQTKRLLNGIKTAYQSVVQYWPYSSAVMKTYVFSAII